MYSNFSHITLGSALRFIAIIALIISVGWYIHFQARNFLQGPSLVLHDPDHSLHHDRIIILNGEADNIVKLTLNGKEITTNTEGAFAQKLVLEDGYTIMTLEAQDRFGRTTSLTREYVYSPLPS